MSKTPYELRYNLLMMAQSIISENLMNDRIRLENDWNQCNEAVLKAANRGGYTPIIDAYPEIPKISVSDIIQMAETLNTFVSKND